jgi:hypothetical protein
VLRDGIPAPILYAADLFDYGGAKLDPLPINLGFAGLRLRFPINAPHIWDEVIAFLGASYYRFLGRGQRYGLSARGLSSARLPASTRSSHALASSGSRRRTGRPSASSGGVGILPNSRPSRFRSPRSQRELGRA